MEFVAEEFDSEWDESVTVDLDKGVIHNVLLCGLESRNGYKFSKDVFHSEAEVKRLYNGKTVCVGHLKDPITRQPVRNRDPKDFGGRIENVRRVNGRPRGDIQTKGYVRGAELLHLANVKHPDMGFSHVAAYKKSKDGKTILGIHEIATVDAVLYPATTSSFSEQDEGKKAMSDSNDKTVEILERQLKEFRTESEEKIAAITKERNDLSAENTELKGKLKTLSAENDENKGKVLQLEQAATISKTRSSVIQMAKEKGIDIKSKLEFPETLVELCVEMDESKRGPYLTEWAKKFSKGRKNSKIPSAAERLDEEGEIDADGDDWDAEAELDKDGYEAETSAAK